MDDPLPLDKYTLVRAADGKLYAVAKDETKPVDGESLVNQVEGAIDTAQTTVRALLLPFGSGVRVKVPKIFEEDQ
jgi:hypothetical protein